MSQKTTFVYKSPNSTRMLNDHIAKIIAEGAYHGMEVEATDPPTMSVNLTAGYALTDEGVKIEETLPIEEVVTFEEADPNYPRIDLVVLRHRYNPLANPNPGTYHVIKGIPTPPPANPLPPDQQFFDPPDILPLHWLENGDVILTEVHIPAGATFIAPDYIFNRTRTMTTTELMARVARALYLAVGNFVYSGWDMTSDVLNIVVSPGEGLLCGMTNSTYQSFIITTLRAREYLYGPNDELNVPYLVGDNLTLDKQPDYASRLRITVTPRGTITSGNIYITGENEFGDVINNEAIYIDCPNPDEPVTIETISKFAEVYHEGIDAHELERAGFDIEIYIKDKPVANIYAVGTNSGRAVFKAVYDPAYTPLCHEYLLGWAETDEVEVIELVRWATDSLAEIIDDLSLLCDSSRRSFALRGIPRLDSEKVVMDGDLLKKDSINGKGYTIVNNIITLQANVPAPDGINNPHGSGGTDFWVFYRRQG